MERVRSGWSIGHRPDPVVVALLALRHDYSRDTVFDLAGRSRDWRYPLRRRAFRGKQIVRACARRKAEHEKRRDR